MIRKEVIKEFFEIPIYLKDFAEDRMSDLITNIILGELAKYSIDQCELIDSGKYITKEKVNLGKGWDRKGQKWIDIESRVIRLNSKEILLFPKSMVRKNLFYSPEKYFRHIILDWRQDDHLEKETDLIRIHPKTNKKSPPAKKVIMEKEFKDKGLLKDICVRTTLDNPGVLEEYKKRYQAKLRYAKPLIDDELMQVVMKTKLELEALV